MPARVSPSILRYETIVTESRVHTVTKAGRCCGMNSVGVIVRMLVHPKVANTALRISLRWGMRMLPRWRPRCSRHRMYVEPRHDRSRCRSTLFTLQKKSWGDLFPRVPFNNELNHSPRPPRQALEVWRVAPLKPYISTPAFLGRRVRRGALPDMIFGVLADAAGSVATTRRADLVPSLTHHSKS